jgi:hypothetical protein
MNPLVSLLALLGVCFLVALCWMARWPLPEESSPDADEKIEDLLPLHTQHFPQLKHSLDSTDKRYIGSKLSREMECLWREERRKILKSFVEGLARDFGRVIRLGRVVDSIAVNSAKPDGRTRSWVAMQFRLHFRILSLWIFRDGPLVIWQLRRLTAAVGSLSALAEAAMMRVEPVEEEDGVPTSFNG